MTPSREAMSGVDLAWLRMERPTNPMAILGVLTFASRLRFEDLRAALQARLLRFERFRQLPVSDALGTHWETDPHFDVDSHLVRLHLPSRAGQAQLEAAASELASTQLDPRRPLWQIQLIERYRKGSAIIARFHHCYADGIALMRVLLSLTEPRPSRVRASRAGEVATAGPIRDGQSGLFSFPPLVGSAAAAVQGATQAVMELLSASLHTLANPEEAAALARKAAEASRELANITLMPDDPPTPLRGPLGTHKQVAWAEPLPLSEIKAVGAALGCTINDVLLASAAGALGSHLMQRGVPLHGLTIRALVPVNLRDPAREPALGNDFGLVFANLPIGERNPLARLYAVHRDMERLKHSAQAVVALWLLTAMGLLPGAVEERLIELFTSKATVVISNVPGPRRPLYLGSARIDQQFFWVPQAGSIGVGLSLLTYDGQVHFGLMADRNLIAAPHTVARLFVEEFERLLLCVLAGPLALEAT